MNDSTATDSRSSPQSGGVISRAPEGATNDTAQPSLTSGFGALIEKERELQSATESSFGRLTGYHAAELDRILHRQHTRLGALIALLEQRFEALPKPERFANWHDRSPTPSSPRAPREKSELLPDLIGRHTRLLADIDALIGCAPDGQRGELILTEVSRSHEEMAWMLTALLKEDETAGRFASERSSERTGEARRAQENWDNEGGSVPAETPVGRNGRSAGRPDMKALAADERQTGPFMPTTTIATHEEVTRRAFELWCENGRREGTAADDWSAAERELEREREHRLLSASQDVRDATG